MKNTRILAEITVVGPDRGGVVAGVTNYIFQNNGNIEKINQNVISQLFGMQLEASFQKSALNENEFQKGLLSLGKALGMQIRVHFDAPTRPKNMALLVSKETHCFEAIVKAKARGQLKARIPIVIGTDNSLKPLAKKYGLPFAAVHTRDQAQAETQILKLAERHNIDLIVLARYMRILTPNFVWRYPNRIINIHPSILPAFPGAYAYAQAFERGAQIIGCTAHFVTEDLDQGPIIWQESFRVKPAQTLESCKAEGKKLEAQTLLRAIQLYLDNKLEVYWGKVHFKKR